MSGFDKESAPAPTPSGDSEQTAAPGEAGRQTSANDGRASADDDVKLPSRPSLLTGMSEHLLKRIKAPPPDASALNSQVMQAMQMGNSETAGYVSSQVAIAPDMITNQTSGLVTQSATNYFDGVSKVALASQAILLRQMTQNIVENELAQVAEDALGALAIDLPMGTVAAVAAAARAIEAKSASFAIDKIDQSIAKYSETLAGRSGKDTQLQPPPTGPAASGPDTGEPSWPISSWKNRSGSIAIPPISVITSSAPCRWRIVAAGRATAESSMSASGE